MISFSGATRIVGVTGWPVEHSLSPAMHQAVFYALKMDWVYAPFPVPPEKLEQALRALPALGIVGVNCTIPHKESAARIVDEIDPQARAIGAVNTVTVLPDGRLHGANTDATGFIDSLKLDGGFDPAGRIVVLLGTGGAGRAMAFALADAGVEKLALVNRTAERAHALARDLAASGSRVEISVAQPGTAEALRVVAETDLLVNSTSLGLKPGDPLPVDVSHLPGHATVYDAVYIPLMTPLLQAAQARGLKTIPGLGMLARQGARSFERWTGIKPDVGMMMQTLREQLSLRQR